MGQGNSSRLTHIGAVAFATLGCKVNQAESDQFARGFAAAGLRVVDFEQPADAYIINSCTVTHVADRKSRQLIRQARRANPCGLVVATGCYAAVAADEVATSTPIDLVVSNQDKPRLVALVLAALRPPEPSWPQATEAVSPLPGNRTRAFVKVQDGCDSACAFCVIPYARGRERSVPLAEVVAAVRQRLAAGHREVLLTGVHIGTYGHDLTPPVALRDLLRTVLEETAVARLRLSSIEPWNFDPAILDFWSSGRLCRHFHLALQSGSDAVLRRMRRPYDVAGFAALLETIRSRVPDVALTSDVIVGFPGESESEFAESLAAVARLDFAKLHVFPYSPRRRTAAARMPGQVPPPVKKARTAASLAAAATAARRFRQRFLGRTLDVLYVQPVATPAGQPTLWEGLTDNYIRVLAPSVSDVTNRVVPTLLLEDEGDALRGALAN